MPTNNPAPESLNVLLSGLLRHGAVYKNSLDEVHVYLPERIPHIPYEEARTYVCKGPERLHDIVTRHYRGMLESPVDAVEIVAQYQEEPILDTSIPLPANRVLLLPPPSYIVDVAYGDSLADVPKI